MDVSAALFTVAIAVGSLAPAPASAVSPTFEAPIAAAVASADMSAGQVRDIQSLRRLSLASSSTKRPSMLIPMYASLAVLQGFDIYTTSAALKNGAVEANPLMQPAAGRNVASVVVKAAATAGSIYFTERAWKQNRKGAVILLTAINVAAAAVVARNTQLARQK
jgi:hypothetical protein